MTAPVRQHVTLRQDERGIALAIAIFALVIIATLVAGAFFMARLEQRSGNNALWSTQAQEAADAGLNATLADWNTSYNSITPGIPEPLATVTLGSGIRYTPTLLKISNEIFLVESVGQRVDAGGGVLSGARVGRIVRIVRPDVEIDAAVVSNGPVTLAGNVTVNGNDTDPDGWPACASGATVASVRTSQSIGITGKLGNGPYAYGAGGDPDGSGLVASDGDKYNQIMVPYTTFKELAKPPSGKTFTGNWSASDSPRPVTQVVGGSTVCNRADARNWGEPWRPTMPGTITQCTSYSPVVWIKGNADISGGRGQGIILVEGDVVMSGGFEFVGVMIVLGDVRTTGTGAKITGALLALNETSADDTYLGGNPMVSYSSCAIASALTQVAYARPLAERSWVQMY